LHEVAKMAFFLKVCLHRESLIGKSARGSNRGLTCLGSLDDSVLIPLLDNPILVLQKLPLALARMAKIYSILGQMVQKLPKALFAKMA
jgi:hypothetical protein